MARRLPIAALVAVSLLLACGCAAGRWIAGAPAGSGGGRALEACPVLARRCANCHQAPDPAAMSAEAWNAGLERMKLRMHLPAAEWDSLAAMAGRGH